MNVFKYFLCFITILTLSCSKDSKLEVTNKIEKLLKSGKEIQAIQMIESVLADYPDHPELYYYKGWTKLKRSPKSAKENFEKSISLDPNFANGYKGLAVVSIMNNDFKSAKKNYQKALDLSKSNERKAVIKSNIAQMYMNNLKQNRKALTLYKEAIKLNDIGDYYSGLGSAHYLNGKHKLAEKIWINAVETKTFVEKKFIHEIYYKLAAFYAKREKNRKALIYIEKAIKLAPWRDDYQRLKNKVSI